MIDLLPADLERLRALFELYTYDLSELLGLDIGDDGRFRVPPLDGWFSDARSHAFLLTVDGKLAGFALVRQKSRLSGDESVYDMAEFFVLRRYRRRGIGGEVAGRLFSRFAGRWEVRQRAQNREATAFWRRAIDRYTGGRFQERVVDDERWQGPVQCFDSA